MPFVQRLRFTNFGCQRKGCRWKRKNGIPVFKLTGCYCAQFQTTLLVWTNGNAKIFCQIRDKGGSYKGFRISTFQLPKFPVQLAVDQFSLLLFWSTCRS